jgi:DNA repair protein RecO (recombination protein O)
MTTRRSTDTRAILVRQVDYGDADRVVTLLTEQCGILAAMARGARSSRKRFGASLSFFVEAEAQIQHRGSDLLPILLRYEAVRTFPGILKDLAAISQASYVTEVVGALCPPDQPEPSLYALLVEALERLDQGKVSSSALRVVELRALGASGYLPRLNACARCDEPLGDGGDGWGFAPDRGGALCPACAPELARVPAGALGGLSRLLGSTLDEADAQDAALGGLRSEIRALTAAILGAVTGRAFRSVAFIDKLRT